VDSAHVIQARRIPTIRKALMRASSRAEAAVATAAITAKAMIRTVTSDLPGQS
jgi:hypothetical protein